MKRSGKAETENAGSKGMEEVQEGDTEEEEGIAKSGRKNVRRMIEARGGMQRRGKKAENKKARTGREEVQK